MLGLMPTFCPGAKKFSTLTFVALSDESDSSSTTVTVPTGSAVGDIGIIYSYCFNPLFGVAAFTVSTWTTICEEVTTNDFMKARILYKVLDASDISAGIITADSASSSTNSMITIRPDGPPGSFSAAQTGAQYTTGDPASQTISGGTAPCILVGGCRGSGSAPTPTGTLVSNGSNAGNQSGSKRYFEIQNSSFSSRTFDMGDHGSNIICSGRLDVSA